MRTYVKVSYFKASGKYYSEATWIGELEANDYQLATKYKAMVEATGNAPGLSSKGHDFITVLTPEGGVPRLVLPEGMLLAEKAFKDGKPAGVVVGDELFSGRDQSCTIVCGDIHNFGGTCNHGRKS